VPTQTKPKIDPAVEDGAVLLAEQVLPPNERRLELALALEEAWRPFAATEARIEAAIERVKQITDKELPACSDDATRKELLAERTDLAGQLDHAGSDIEAVGTPYMGALGTWAAEADLGTRRAIRRIVSEEQPLRVAQTKIRQKLDPSLSPLEAASESEKAALQKEFAGHRESIEALVEEKKGIENLAQAIGRRVWKFGDRAHDGALFTRAGQRDWLKRTRVRMSRLATDRTGVSDMLRPMGRG